MKDYSYIGKGRVSMRVFGSNTPLMPVGNCSSLQLSVTEDIKSLPDYTSTGGGTYNEVRRVGSIELSMTLHDLSAENMARAIYGTTAAVGAGTATNEALGVSAAGGFLVTQNAIDVAQTVTVVPVDGAGATTWAATTAYSLDDCVKPVTPAGYYYRCTAAGSSGGMEPTWPTTVGSTVVDGGATWTCMGLIAPVVGTDYTATAGGITLADDVMLADGEALQVSYTKVAAKTIEALLSSSQEYELFFDGLNDAASGRAVLTHIYRVKLGATDGMDLIGDDYYAGTQTGKLLKDASKNGVSESQYFKATVVD